MRIAVVGASGFIGQHVYQSCRAAYSESDIVGTFKSNCTDQGLVHLDATDPTGVRDFLSVHTLDVVILCSGFKDVRACEADWETAYNANVRPVANFLEACGDACCVVTLSSDYVFAGQSGPYRDTDEPCPQTNYGKSKLLAEQLVAQEGRGLVVRTSAVIGRGSTFWEWLSRELKAGNRVEMYDDVFFSPTPIRLLTDILLDIINEPAISGQPGSPLHVVGPCRLSRLEFAGICRSLLGASDAILLGKEREPESLIPYDVSMQPSAYVQERAVMSFEDYLGASIQ